MVKQKNSGGNGKVFEGKAVQVKLSDIGPNPHKLDRHGRLHLQDSKIAGLRRSADDKGYWNDPFHIYPNPQKDSKNPLLAGVPYCQLWGHHRHQIAVETLGPDAAVNCILHSVDAEGALVLMMEENREVYGETTQTQAENIEATVRLFASKLPEYRANGRLAPINPKLMQAMVAGSSNPFEPRSKPTAEQGGWPATTYTAQDVAEFARISYRTAARHIAALRGLYDVGVSSDALGKITRESLERVGNVARLVSLEATKKGGKIEESHRRNLEAWARESLPTFEDKSERAGSARVLADIEGGKAEKARVAVPHALTANGSKRKLETDEEVARAIGEGKKIVFVDLDRQKAAASPDDKFTSAWKRVTAYLVKLHKEEKTDKLAACLEVIMRDLAGAKKGKAPVEIADQDEQVKAKGKKKSAAKGKPDVLPVKASRVKAAKPETEDKSAAA